MLSSPQLSAALAMSAAAMVLGSALSHELRPRPVCPTCYTSTIWLPAPCPLPPISCTGPSTPPPGGCTSTVDLRPTTFTVPGLNPACPTTPRVTSALPCPTAPACSQSNCNTVTLGTPGPGAGGVRTTITELPLKCVATTTYAVPGTTTRSISFDTTRTPPPPPPFPTLPPDEE